MYSLILHGRRLFELQKWRHLSVSVKLFQNASSFSSSFSSATAIADVSPRDGLKGEDFSVSYLVDSLGLSRKLAESISRKVSFEDKVNSDSVLNLLRRYGFTDSQISSIITDYPGLLIVDAEKSLGPKLKFLQSRGASNSELTEIVSKVPKLLGRRGGKTISVYYDCVKEIIVADKSNKLEKLSNSLPEGSRQENIVRNVLVLRDLGMPQKLLFPLLISNLGIVCGKERFEESLKKVVEMGFDPKTFKFVEALSIVYKLSDKTIEEKVNVFKTLGFVVEDVWEMFKKWPPFLRPSEKNILNSVDTYLGLGFSKDEFVMMIKSHPPCIGYSAESVKKKIEFLVKQMNWPLRAVALNPRVLSYNMEKRIVPRCDVIKALLSKGLLSEFPTLSPVLACADEVFIKRYVTKHHDEDLAAELMSTFTGDHSIRRLVKVHNLILNF